MSFLLSDFSNIEENLPKSKRKLRRKSSKHFNRVLKSAEANSQFYLGDIAIGTSNNVVPDMWEKCSVNFLSSRTPSDDFALQLCFDECTTVLVSIALDFKFVKNLFTFKVFAMLFSKKDDALISQLYLTQVPLPVFTNNIGCTLKTAISLIFGVTAEYSDESPTAAPVEDTSFLYRNFKNFQCNRTKTSNIQLEVYKLKPQLRPYQEDAVRWMIQQEIEPKNKEILHPLYEELPLKTGIKLYFNKYTGYIETRKPFISNFQRGGILADEMGLGKTVEVLACVVSHPKPPDKLTNDCNNISKERVMTDLKSDSSNSGSTAILPFNLEENSSPVVLQQPKKRKIKISQLEGDQVEEPKKIKLNRQAAEDTKINKNSKKSDTRIALERWYERLLSMTICKLPETSSQYQMQCICGNIDMIGAVECVDCCKYQHGKCLGYKNKNADDYRCPQCWTNQPFIESKATLIICPASLQYQWREEICKHLNIKLKVLIYEGSKAMPIYPDDFCHYDIVITTYSVLQAELRLSESGKTLSLRKDPRYSTPGSPISRIKWWRLCLDEAQAVEIPHSMVSTMAKKIEAHYRWAVTGTPITKNVSDLYGLVDYLQLSPYNEYEVWKYLLYLPFIHGNTEPLLLFLSQVMWRSSKVDVIDQINIPEQTVKHSVLEFSAVEKYYYNREHELWSSDFFQRIQNYDNNIPLQKLDKSSLKKIMTPFRALRNACSHPNAIRGRYLATRKQVNSMEDLLNALIEKNCNECEENLRLIISALNGLAGLYLLLQNPLEAVSAYRSVLQLVARFTAENSKQKLNVDKLQIIHALHNLAEVLQTSPPVEPTLRDDQLREDCCKMQEKHMERYTTQSLAAYEESAAATETVQKLEEKFLLASGQWFSELLDWVTISDVVNDLHNRISTLCANANIQQLEYSTEKRLLYMTAIWNEDIVDMRTATANMLKQMYSYSKDTNKITISDSLVQAAMNCHLRPQEKTKKKKCLICNISMQMRKYEAKLFNMSKQNKEENDISNKGSWKPTAEELILKALLMLGKSKNANEVAIADGEIYFNSLEARKKEFKQLRKFWTYLDQQICAYDEIDICKTRLSLKQTQKEGSRRVSKTDKILKNLSTVLENKLEYINLIEAHEIDYQVSLLKNEKENSTAALECALGTHNYLETLRNQQYAGQSPDPCPVCKNPLKDNWSILSCGHCYCLECIGLLLEKTNSRRICCSVCRQYKQAGDVSYIRTDMKVTDEEQDINIKGNFSTKVEAVVKLIMKLRHETSDVKILLFSERITILKIIKTALEINEITVELGITASTLSYIIQRFKDAQKNVTVLLLPIHLGSKGLNLVEASHVILLEPVLNPADELQAIGRIHRIGQTKETCVYKFMVKNTIEESIHYATSTDKDSWDKNKVTILQLQHLFAKKVEGSTSELNNADVL